MTFQYTPEQIAIASYQGDLLVVRAGSGCAKTSTLELFAQTNPQERMLYLVFGKANREEAEQRFKNTNVVPRTQHAIALARCGLDIRHKLTDNYRLTDIKRFLNLSSWDVAQEVHDVFNAYLISAHRHIHECGANKQINALVEKLWDAARDPKSSFPCKPDVYLKHYCLQPPELHLWFKTILLDEAQDTNPVVSDWIMRQSCRKIIVGDDEQQLFGFRGAKNFLSDLLKNKQPDELTLSQSFRFGQSVAEIANAVIRLKYRFTQQKHLILKGNPTRDTFIYAGVPDHWQSRQYAILHRTTSGVIESALEHSEKRIYWIGGFDRYRAQDILDVYYLAINKRDLIVRRKLLVEVKSIKEYRDITERTQDPEQKRILRLIDRYQSNLPTLIQDIKSRTVTDIDKADRILGTVHGSKGLEFPLVSISDDFFVRQKFIENKLTQVSPEEFNLLYVAATRAKEGLACNSVINFVVRQDEHAKNSIAYLPLKASGLPTDAAQSQSVTRLGEDAPRSFSSIILSD